jgi:hypothetical protein
MRQFVLFWYDFVVGDDWRAAAGVVIALAVTKLAASSSFTAWWIVPIAVVLGLPLSLRHLRRSRAKEPAD